MVTFAFARSSHKRNRFSACAETGHVLAVHADDQLHGRILLAGERTEHFLSGQDAAIVFLKDRIAGRPQADDVQKGHGQHHPGQPQRGRVAQENFPPQRPHSPVPNHRLAARSKFFFRSSIVPPPSNL